MRVKKHVPFFKSWVQPIPDLICTGRSYSMATWVGANSPLHGKMYPFPEGNHISGEILHNRGHLILEFEFVEIFIFLFFYLV